MSYIRARIKNRLDFEIVACRKKKTKRKEKKKNHLVYSFFPGGEQPKGRKGAGGGEKQDGDKNRYLHNETPINQSIHGRRESLSETSTGINRRGR